jgi:pyruvate kinase
MPAQALPRHKTKIVATIGPASDPPEILEELIRSGLSVARLNFSHGDFSSHADRIARIRAAERAAGRRVTIMADLPGPKMRVGKINPEPVQLRAGQRLVLTTDDITGSSERVGISFEPLPHVVKPGDRILLNDGVIQIVVESVSGNDVECRVAVGGELRSKKGLNLPGIHLGISAFTDNDRACLEFALAQGVDAVSQSFVESAADIEAVRAAAAAMGKHPFIIAKIERADALAHLDDILSSADGIMVARGDLGVEVPVHEVAIHCGYSAEFGVDSCRVSRGSWGTKNPGWRDQDSSPGWVTSAGAAFGSRIPPRLKRARAGVPGGWRRR